MTRSPLLLGLLALLACSDAAEPADGTPDAAPDTVPRAGQGVRLEEVASGLELAVYLTAPAGDPRLFIVEQPGRVRVVEGGSRLVDTPFLDLTDRVLSGGERGLLGVAFHPRYSSNGYLYVNYTDRNGDTQIERYQVSRTDRNRADPASAKRILSIPQPYANHNGGHLLFGPDGMLYIPTGDGGSGGDPQDHAENLGSLLGKMLRIDVDRGDPYAVPDDNPFRGRAGARGEIWAYGLRNPWRVAFDREGGMLYVADVGQNLLEEVNVVRAGEAGLNYGWDVMEGSRCYEPQTGCDRAGKVLPVLEYGRDQGQSITGGYVYRGSALPALRGHYFYADYVGRWVRSFRYADGQAVDRRTWDFDGLFGNLGGLPSFGEDAQGELYLVSHRGRVYKLVPG